MALLYQSWLRDTPSKLGASCFIWVGVLSDDEYYCCCCTSVSSLAWCRYLASNGATEVGAVLAMGIEFAQFINEVCVYVCVLCGCACWCVRVRACVCVGVCVGLRVMCEFV